MTRLVLHTTALKIPNRGGGLVDRHEKEKDSVTGRIMKVIRRYKEEGSEYMTFICPRCERRQKRSAYEVIYLREDGDVVFHCNQYGCDAEIEVSRPPKAEEPASRLIVSPEEYRRQERGKHGTV
jgi:hypothetical protein